MGASNWEGLALRKPTPRWKQKAKRAAENTRIIKAAYAEVDRRDQHCCRICFKRVGGVGLLYAVHHHHLVSRSIAPTATKHCTQNIASLCNACHDAVENSGTVRLTGNADERNSVGVLSGLKLEKLTESGWVVVGWR